MYYNERAIFELLLQKIQNLTYIVSDGEEISFAMDTESGLYDVKLSLVKGALRKMANELGLLEIVSEADVSQKEFASSAGADELQKHYYDKEYTFRIKINTREFNKYFQGYLDYNGGMVNYNLNQADISVNGHLKDRDIKIEYKNRKLLLNRSFLLANPDFNSENDLVCEQLFKNVGKTLPRKVLEESLKQPLKKDLNKIAEQLGFKKDIRKVFLSVSKNNISLKRTSISKEELNNLGLDYIRL